MIGESFLAAWDASKEQAMREVGCENPYGPYSADSLKWTCKCGHENTVHHASCEQCFAAKPAETSVSAEQKLPLPQSEWLQNIHIADLLGTRHASYETAWRRDVEIIPAYVPPYPRPGDKPTCVVHYKDAFLRYSCGPAQGFFWDCYGDDFLNVALALRAILECPIPPERGGEAFVFRIDLPLPQSEARATPTQEGE
jgi:hypothetical protein